MASRVTFLNTYFDRMTQAEAVQTVLEQLLERRGQRIFYANAHTMVTASQDSRLNEALQRCHLLLADGSGVRWGSALLGTPLTYNLNGTDLVPALCRAGGERQLSVYLLGGRPGVAEEAARHLQAGCPGLIIAGTQHGYFSPEKLPEVLENIRQARPHLLLVAMGVPKQEIWIDQYAGELPGISCMGVGGLFDFLAKRVPRAPRLVRAVGMEWGWRLLMEPGRLWKRYLIGNLLFIRLVAAHALSAHPVEAQPEAVVIYDFETETAVKQPEYPQARSA